MKELICAIVSVGELITRGGYDIIPVKMKNLSTQEFYEVSVFTNGKEFTFKKGDEIEVPLTVKEWKGKKQYSASLNNIVPVEQQIIKDPISTVPQSVWDAKDRRMVRMNALSHAVQTIAQEHPANVEKIGRMTRADLIIEVAAHYETWINGGKRNEMPTLMG